MNWKSLALVSTSIVALGFSASASMAAPPPTMAQVDLGYTYWWDDFRWKYGSSTYTESDEYPSLTGSARVNMPYSEHVNIQVDMFGDASLDSASGGEGGNGIGEGNFGGGAHINYRDDTGLLGVFGAVGRVWDTWGEYSTPAYMAGIEGQYYCGHWTFYGQAGYMDSDNNSYVFLENAGFVRGQVSYYASPRLKLNVGLAYMDGDIDQYYDATAWAWQADVHYWFGKSVPVAAFLKYQGRQADDHYGGGYDGRLDSNEVTAGVTWFFGGPSGDIETADRDGPGTDIPNFDWFRQPWED